MHFKFPRVAVAALVALGLAACTGQPTIPSPAPQSFASVIANAASPCKVQGSWYFKGTCVAAKIKSSPGKLTLAAYKGLTLSLAFPKGNAKNAVFVIGEGTSSADITGTFNNTTFIDYRTVPCETPQGETAKCPGKAFLYVKITNTATVPVTFQNLPTATVTTTGQFPGTKKCGVIQMGFANSSGVAIPNGWILLPGSAKPQGKKLAFPAQKGSFPFGRGSSVFLGYTCR